MISLLLLALLQTAPAKATPAKAAPAGPPAWTYREGADATTGKKWATAQIRATEGNGRLVVRCDTAGEPIVSIQYIPKPPLPASDPKIVRVTYDEAKVEVAGWQFPGMGAYYGEPISVFIMVGEVVAAKTIVVDTDDATGAQLESSFAGPGSDAMFRQVYATCGFPYEMPPVPLSKD